MSAEYVSTTTVSMDAWNNSHVRKWAEFQLRRQLEKAGASSHGEVKWAEVSVQIEDGGDWVPMMHGALVGEWNGDTPRP